jgi:hypothetical protein
MFEVHDPRGMRSKREAKVAARPRSLQNLALGILDNGKTNSDALLERAVSLLTQRGARVIARAHKPSWGMAAEPEVIDSLAHCALVVTAHGG